MDFSSNVGRSGLWVVGITCLLWADALPAAAHPFHISTAEVEFDADSDRLQVGLKVQAVDLERALSAHVGRSMTLDQPQVDRQLVDYLQRVFYLAQETPATAEISSDAAAPQAPAVSIGRRLSAVHWVGMESQGTWVWLYFELELPPQRQSLRLVNTVLCDVNVNQINTVTVRHAAQRATLKMTSQQPSARFEATWLSRG